MAYAIRTKGKFLIIRDPSHPTRPLRTDPVYVVGPIEWVGFEHLPVNTSESGDTDLEVEAVEVADGVWPDWVTRPESVQAKRAAAMAAAAPAEPTPQPEPVFEKPRRKAKFSDNARPVKDED